MTFFPKQISQLMKRFIYWRCTAEIILKYRKKKKKRLDMTLFPMIITKAYSDLRLSPYFLIQLWLFNLIAVLGKPKRPERLPDGLLVIVCNKYPFRMVLTFPTGWANPQMCFKLFNTLLKKKKKKIIPESNGTVNPSRQCKTDTYSGRSAEVTNL